MSANIDSCYEVRQNEVGIMARNNANNPSTGLYTVGINPCVGLVFWNSDWIALAHIENGDKNHIIAGLEPLVDALQQSGGKPTVQLFYSKNYKALTHEQRVHPQSALAGVWLVEEETEKMLKVKNPQTFLMPHEAPNMVVYKANAPQNPTIIYDDVPGVPNVRQQFTYSGYKTDLERKRNPQAPKWAINGASGGPIVYAYVGANRHVRVLEPKDLEL